MPTGEIHCGDCGSVTRLERKQDRYEYRICDRCGTAARQSGIPNKPKKSWSGPRKTRARIEPGEPPVRKKRAPAKLAALAKQAPNLCAECSVRRLDASGNCPHCDE